LDEDEDFDDDNISRVFTMEDPSEGDLPTMEGYLSLKGITYKKQV